MICEYSGSIPCTERLTEYWEVEGRMLCEKHAASAGNDEKDGGEWTQTSKAQKRVTRFMNITGGLGGTSDGLSDSLWSYLWSGEDTWVSFNTIFLLSLISFFSGFVTMRTVWLLALVFSEALSSRGLFLFTHVAFYNLPLSSNYVGGFLDTLRWNFLVKVGRFLNVPWSLHRYLLFWFTCWYHFTSASPIMFVGFQG